MTFDRNEERKYFLEGPVGPSGSIVILIEGKIKINPFFVIETSFYFYYYVDAVVLCHHVTVNKIVAIVHNILFGCIFCNFLHLVKIIVLSFRL